MQRTTPFHLSSRHPLAARRVGHVHASGGAERHHHPAGDGTVVVDAADGLSAADADDLGLSPSIGALVGLISAPSVAEAESSR